eukprot:CAMPEP_0172153304 /NCGR_PEP_ID=MMETSP1050-20130122/1359_1 /TAXON_ID=233186 /ORGANISM="Cryptomonas curvata, Strain CCAP979/52" /LENGTH=105 /DNA_ID=CAMNT_0012821803 /DNA_START=266 /DNA_END=582 /DNA_ORIENTATION=+
MVWAHGAEEKVLPGFDSEVTFGGCSKSVVVDEEYVIRIPDAIDLAKAALLLCAGITTFSPLAHFGAKAKGAACITGVAASGHMAVKLARAMRWSSRPGKRAAVGA